MNRFLALVAAPRVDTPEATEFLRTIAALRALDCPVDLAEIGRGVGTLTRDPVLSPDGERYWTVLAEDGVRPRADLDVAEAVSQAFALLLLPDPERAGTPELLRLVRGSAVDEATLADLVRAGQVVVDAPAEASTAASSRWGTR